MLNLFKSILRITSVLLSLFVFFYLFIIQNFFISSERSIPRSPKANAHTLQTVLETYAVDWKGEYPTNVKNLKLEASQKGYWKDFKNPFERNKKSVQDLQNTIKINNSTGEVQINNFEAGAVIYAPIKVKNVVIKYYLYCVSKEDNKLIVDKGQVFYLSNS